MRAAHSISLEEQEEAKERRDAELLFLESAYSPEEVAVQIHDEWETTEDGGIYAASVTRWLRLPADISSDATTIITGDCDNTNVQAREGEAFIDIKLELSLFSGYPVSCDAADLLQVSASLDNTATNPCPRTVRKAAMDLLPSLLESCRKEIVDNAGSEAIFLVFNAADLWIEQFWSVELQSRIIEKREKTNMSFEQSEPPGEVILGRRVIYSHHIISKVKRRDMTDLVSEYNLGGVIKIGWPGILIIEGLEENCTAVLKHIKLWQWKYLTVRGEERIAIATLDFESKRKLLPSGTLVEFDQEGGMANLANLLREAGLEHLFKIALKLDDGTTSSENNEKHDSDDKK